MITYSTALITCKNLRTKNDNYYTRWIPWLLVVFSAVLYAGSFFWCGLLAAVYLVPFLCVQRYMMLRVKHVSVWLIVAYGLMCFPCALDVCGMSQGNWWQTVLPPFFLYVYLVVASISFFACFQGIVQKIVRVPGDTACMQWALAWVAYWLFVDHYIFSLFLRVEGFPFFSPLVPLAQYASTLAVVAWGGMTFCSVLVHGTVAALFLCTTQRWRAGVVILGVVLSICGVAWYKRPSTESPSWVYHVRWVPGSMCSSRSDLCIVRNANMVFGDDDDNTLCIMPESALEGYCGETVHGDICSHGGWQGGALLAGIHTQLSGGWHNSVVLADRESCAIVYIKQRTMPLIEQLPAWACWPWVCDAYLYQQSGIIPATQERKPVDVPGIGPMLLYLCSDLFLEINAPQYPGVVIALVNDNWVRYSFLQRSLMLLARLKSATWGRVVVYCSYRYGCVMIPCGQIMPLNDFRCCEFFVKT